LVISILGFQPCESVLWPGSFLKGDILIAKAVKSILEGLPRKVGFHGFCQVVG
jgi:pantothenate synthetase